MPYKLHVFTFHLERLYRYIKYKNVWLEICILDFPFAVFKILYFGQSVLYVEAEGELQCLWWW